MKQNDIVLPCKMYFLLHSLCLYISLLVISAMSFLQVACCNYSLSCGFCSQLYIVNECVWSPDHVICVDLVAM